MLIRTAALLEKMIIKLENQLGVQSPGVPILTTSAPFQTSQSLEDKHSDDDYHLSSKDFISEKFIKNENSLFSKVFEEAKSDFGTQGISLIEKPISQNEEVPIPSPNSNADLKDKEDEPIDLSKAPYDLFPQIDIRVGHIVECWKHPSSDYLYCEKIDISEGSLREIGSGLQQYISLDEMSGTVCVMSNLKPRKLGGFISNGMVLALHTKNESFELLRPGNLEIGERIGLEDILKPEKSPFLPIMNPKKKVLEKTIPYFVTDNEGFACFGLKKLLTSVGYIKTNHPNARIS
ncbi:hypothetical protein SteCoe_8513 [Stentor coeruleus]|uniref:tRNA-binding domain-containing protein n=1 Tax=Stentor coeruleus TaxID=5963 RepID=A0A1R2CK32_9CILI|nr:hypothetical protein SteCoe_8513 [Stentor coeruleus]